MNSLFRSRSMCLRGAVVTASSYESVGPGSILAGAVSAKLTQLSILPFGLVGRNLGKVNCGSPDFIVALCPGLVEYYPPQAQRPMMREMSARGHAHQV